MRTIIKRTAPLVAGLLLITACGSDDTSDSAATETTAVGDDSAPADTTADTTGDSDDSVPADTTGDSDDTTADTTADSDEAAATGACTADLVGGSVTVGMSTQPGALDPAQVNGSPTTGGIEIIHIYDALMKYDPESGEYSPKVAESLESDDFSTWTLTLRDGVTFTNGAPLTADAVKASIERFGEVNTGPARNLVAQIATMNVVDESTLEFELVDPWSGFPYVLANTPGMIVDPAAVEAAGETFGTEPTAAGVGPYTVARFAPGEELVLEAKADYWGGPVCIEELRFVPLPEDNGRYEAFTSGEFQATWLRDPFAVAESESDGVAGISNLQNAQNVVLFNAGSDGPGGDERIRRAVSMILDQDVIADRAFEGAGNPTSLLIGEQSRYYDADVEGPVLDAAAGTALLDEAKADGWDGTMRLLCASSSEEVALTMEAQLEAAGMDIDLSFKPDSRELAGTVIGEKDFDAACWGLNILDDGLWATLHNSLSSESASNYGGYVDAGVDAALADLKVAGTEDEIKAALATMQERFNETAPVIILNAGTNRMLHIDELKGLQPTTNSLTLFEGAYLDG